jgi:hypothetical protein
VTPGENEKEQQARAALLVENRDFPLKCCAALGIMSMILTLPSRMTFQGGPPHVCFIQQALEVDD